MARYATTRYVVNHRQITMMIMPGGEVARHIDNIAQDAYRFGKRIVPVRTGRLRRGLNWNRSKPDSADRTTAKFISSAAHSFWVNDGTSRIYARPGKWLLVPRRGGPNSVYGKGGGRIAYDAWVAKGKKGRKGFSRRDSVSGQRGQHYMEKSLKAAMATFRAGG